MANISRCHLFSFIVEKQLRQTQAETNLTGVWLAVCVYVPPSISGQFLHLPLPVSEKAQPPSTDDPFSQPLWDRLRSPYPPGANNAVSVRPWNQTLPVCPPRPPPLTFTAFHPTLMFDGRERPRQILSHSVPFSVSGTAGCPGPWGRCVPG